MHADGSLIYGLRPLFGEELGAVCTFLYNAKCKAFVQRIAGPWDVQGRACLAAFVVAQTLHTCDP